MINIPIHVEELTFRLLQNRITKVPSKHTLSYEQAYESLLACYLAEVRSRGRDFLFSEELSSQMQLVTDWLTNLQAKPWLLLCGTCGNGKSTMTKALRQFYNLYPLFDPQGGSPMGLVMTDAKKISAYCRNDDKAFLELMKKPMLAIDDLGIEPLEVLTFGNISTPLVDLLTDRYEEQRITVITTNLTPAQIRSNYGDRVADRLNEMAEKIIFKNTTYRCDDKMNNNIQK